VVETLEANAYGTRSLAEANQTHTLDDAVAGFGDNAEPNNNERCRFDCFGACNAISACSDGTFRHYAIHIFRNPSPNLFDWTNPCDDFAPNEREPFDCFPRVR